MKPLPQFEADLTGKSTRYLEVLERLLLKTVRLADDRLHEANKRLMIVRRAMEAKRVK